MKLVIFDMGNVFVDFNWETVCAHFAQLPELCDKSFRSMISHSLFGQYERGKISTEMFVKELNSLLKTNLSIETFAHCWNSSFAEDPEMSVLLESASERIPLYLLSNTNEAHFNFLEHNYQVTRHFQEIILSHEVGYAKPEEEIYQEIFKRSGLEPYDCLFIDDLATNIEAAKAIGINTIHFRGIKDLTERLPQFGIAV